MSFEKAIYRHRSLFGSSYPNIYHSSIWCRSTKILGARLYGQIFSRNTYDWFRNWLGFENVIGWLQFSVLRKMDRQPGTASPRTIWANV
jgi:hypothetical protein